MSGVYWGLTSMFLMNKQDMMEKDEIIEFVKSCQHENGGFSASHNHDPHLLYTLSAIQVWGTGLKHFINSLFNVILIAHLGLTFEACCNFCKNYFQGMELKRGHFHSVISCLFHLIRYKHWTYDITLNLQLKFSISFYFILETVS